MKRKEKKSLRCEASQRGPLSKEAARDCCFPMQQPSFAGNAMSFAGVALSVIFAHKAHGKCQSIRVAQTVEPLPVSATMHLPMAKSAQSHDACTSTHKVHIMHAHMCNSTRMAQKAELLATTAEGSLNPYMLYGLVSSVTASAGETEAKV